MRVISGTAGRLKLVAPTGRETRPTADREKEAMFSILESLGLLHGASVLDIFAGSGALGIEALSRGAARVTMIDKSRQAVESIRKNLETTSFAGNVEIICADFTVSLERLRKNGILFDLVIIDPPYTGGMHLKTIEIVSGLLKPGAMLVAETSSRSPLPEKAGSLCRSDRRVYGDTAIEFFLAEENHAT